MTLLERLIGVRCRWPMPEREWAADAGAEADAEAADSRTGPLPDGAPCQHDDECAHRCIDRTCSSASPLEGPCDEGDDEDCGEGHVCEAGICLLGDGQLCAAMASKCASFCIRGRCANPEAFEPVTIAGTNEAGDPINQPSDWPPEAGEWNAKGASLHVPSGALLFESYREDIRAGSIADDAIGATLSEKIYYQAGPETGTLHEYGTHVIYVARSNGADPRCIGCVDAVDGVDGVAIYRVRPSNSGSSNAVERRTGRVVYANQHKDLGIWHPSGQWILVPIEMPRHPDRHAIANGEQGFFNDLWAVSTDGKTWVQLTDYASTWTLSDPIARMPFSCQDLRNCPSSRWDGSSVRCQYEGEVRYPFSRYHCSPIGSPPPAVGLLRPRISHHLSGSLAGSALVVMSERVGTDPGGNAWGGITQIAVADLMMDGGIPRLVNYRNNLTPTVAVPGGEGLWANPGGSSAVPAGYETFNFAPGDDEIALATDAFLVDVLQRNGIHPRSGLAFCDIGAWNGWAPTPRLQNLTAYTPGVYEYGPNAAQQALIGALGHWEEPIAFASGPEPYFAFASSANLTPPFDPNDFKGSFALEVWVKPRDGSRRAVRVTDYNGRVQDGRTVAYPTAAEGDDFYLTVIPEFETAANPPGRLDVMRVSTAVFDAPPYATVVPEGGHLDFHMRDGSELLVYDKRGDDGYFDVWVQETSTGGKKCLTCTPPAGFPPRHAGAASWHPSGDYLVIEAQKDLGGFDQNLAVPGAGILNDLYVLAADGSKAWLLHSVSSSISADSAGVLHPHFSHKGDRLLWAERVSGSGNSGFGKWVLRIADFAWVPGPDGAQPRLASMRTFNPGGGDNFFESHSFSPDDQYALFTGSQDRNPGATRAQLDIYELELATGNVRRLTHRPGDWDEHAHYSPDGTRILWVSSKDNGYSAAPFELKTEFWMMDRNGDSAERISHFHEQIHAHSRWEEFVVAADLAWHPNGKGFWGLVITGRPDSARRGGGPIIYMQLSDPPHPG
jgi:hypothetical protein